MEACYMMLIPHSREPEPSPDSLALARFDGTTVGTALTEAPGEPGYDTDATRMLVACLGMLRRVEPALDAAALDVTPAVPAWVELRVSDRPPRFGEHALAWAESTPGSLVIHYGIDPGDTAAMRGLNAVCGILGERIRRHILEHMDRLDADSRRLFDMDRRGLA